MHTDPITAIRRAAAASSIGPRELARQAGISSTTAFRLLAGELSRRDIAISRAMSALGVVCGVCHTGGEDGDRLRSSSGTLR